LEPKPSKLAKIGSKIKYGILPDNKNSEH